MECHGLRVGLLGSIVAVLVVTTGYVSPPARRPASRPHPTPATTTASRLATGVSLDRFIDLIGRKPEIT